MKNKIISFTNVPELSTKLLAENIEDSSTGLMQIFMADVDKETIKTIQQYLQKNFPQTHIIGTTTDGIINQGEVLFGDAQHLLVYTAFEKTKLQSLFIEAETSLKSSYLLGQKIAQKLVVEDTKLLLAFSDGLYTNGEEFVEGISDVAKDVILSGGMAADNGLLEKTYIFDKNNISDNGAVCVAMNSEVLSIATNYTFDWEPIGKKLRVTKAIQNRVYEIEGMSAIDVYAKYMGPEIAERLPQIGIEFPLILERDGIVIGRAVTAKYSDGSLGFAGNIKEGEYVRFGVGAIDEILNNSHYQLQKLLNKTSYKPEAVFVYSCMARRRFLQEHVLDELKPLEHLGPTSGFFTYGEFFHFSNANQLLNETMTVLFLSENQDALDVSFETIDQDSLEYNIRANHVIARLANTVSSELEELNKNLEQRIEENAELILQQVYYDKLTGLPNRLSLIKRLEESLGETIFLINIDDFTTINDFYGHEVGDRVLQKLAKILQDLAGYLEGEVYKLPSDEYALIINIAHERSKIETIMKHIIAHIAKEEFEIDGNLAHVSVSMAAAYINERRTGLANADMTLKMAKKSGQQYMIFDEDLQLSKQYEQNIQIANSIKSAIKDDRIIPYYQPIFSIKTGEIEKYEALVRLVKEDGSVLTPYSFLSVSEKIKLYPKITEIMIEKTFNFFYKRACSFSINLAFSDILNDRTRNLLFSKIVEYDIAKQLTIEILETQEFERNEIITQFIRDVYSYGAKIAIDDFGSGFANFKHMTTIESDYMKIDGSLIRDIVEDENDRLVVETIVSFAKKLGKKTIAEFVHSKEVYDMVKAMGVDFVQGYYLAKPTPTICQE